MVKKRTIGAAKGIPSVDINVDEHTNSIVFISLAHYMVHLGKHFTGDFVVTLAADAVHYSKIVTGADNVHFLCDVSGSGGIEISLLEDVSGGMTGGSSVEAVNSKRTSSETSKTTLAKGVSAPDTITKTLYTKSAGSDVTTGVLKAPINISRENEYVLKPNTTYAFKITSFVNSNRISASASWYEVSV